LISGGAGAFDEGVEPDSSSRSRLVSPRRLSSGSARAGAGDRWYTEDPAGGAEGDSDWFGLHSEDATVELVRSRMVTGEGWRWLDG
jgi:hypothetical protein